MFKFLCGVALCGLYFFVLCHFCIAFSVIEMTLLMKHNNLHDEDVMTGVLMWSKPKRWQYLSLEVQFGWEDHKWNNNFKHPKSANKCVCKSIQKVCFVWRD